MKKIKENSDLLQSTNTNIEENFGILEKLNKNRKKHLKDWSDTPFKDIKNICSSICKCKKYPKKH